MCVSPLTAFLISAPVLTHCRLVRKAVFSMMAMRRMSAMASHLSPEHQRLNEDVFQYKQESEKEVLEDMNVIHHHNADESGSEREGQPKGENDIRFQGDPATAGPEVPAASDSSVNLAKPAEGSKDVSEKLAAVSLTAAAKVSSAVKTK